MTTWWHRRIIGRRDELDEKYALKNKNVRWWTATCRLNFRSAASRVHATHWVTPSYAAYSCLRYSNPVNHILTCPRVTISVAKTYSRILSRPSSAWKFSLASRPIDLILSSTECLRIIVHRWKKHMQKYKSLTQKNSMIRENNWLDRSLDRYWKM